MRTQRQKAQDLLEHLISSGVSEEMILNFIINDHLSGQEALDALEAANDELFNDEDDDEEYEYKVKSFKDKE